MKVKVSVIMSIYNEPPEYLHKSIESIIKQTFQDIEFIIVMDNPSNIDAVDIINEYKQNDKRIVLIENDKNRGLVYSLNRAIQVSSGDYIARMDADDISFPTRIKDQYDYLTEHALDLIGAKIVRIDENEQILSRDKEFYTTEKVMRILKYTDCVAHPSWFAKRNVYDKLRGYRDIRACEDYDFLLRAMNYGFKIGIINKELLYYRTNTEGVSFKNALYQVLMTRVLSKNRKKLDKIEDTKIADKINVTIEQEKRYQEANKLLVKAANSKEFFTIILCIVKSIIKSKSIWHNYFQLLVKKVILMLR